MQTHNSGHIVAAAAIILCSGVLLPADQTTAPGQAPVFRSGVELVTVDVGVVDRQGNPVKGLGAGDFVVNVAGHPRKVVTAEFVDVAGARPQTATAPKETGISTNEGVGVGRMFVFVVDQSTLEPGNVRHVARAASRFFTGLSFVDRSSLVLMPAGPNVDFTWAHDRVQNALGKVIGQASPITSWELGSLTEARDIANRNLVALRTVGQRECGGTFAGGVGGEDSIPSGRRPDRPLQPEGPRVPHPAAAARRPADRAAEARRREAVQPAAAARDDPAAAGAPVAGTSGLTAAHGTSRCARSGRGAARR